MMESALISGDAVMRPIEQIVAECQRGERAAFDLLFERYHSRVYAVAFGILRHEAEAEDAVQDAFVKVYRNIGTFEGDSSFETWLIAITVNCCRDRLRRQKVRQALSLEALTPRALLRALGVSNDPARTMARRERRRNLWEAVGELDMRHRVTLVLRYQEGLSCGEIADILGLSLSTIYTRLSEGRQQLRELLDGEDARRLESGE
ncbi:MAG: RNA polymerase sigma factor [bacterium]